MGMSRSRAERVIMEMNAEVDHYRRLAVISHDGAEWFERRAAEIEQKIAEIERNLEPAGT